MKILYIKGNVKYTYENVLQSQSHVQFDEKYNYHMKDYYGHKFESATRHRAKFETHLFDRDDEV